jgi:DNA-binding LacI/PurR family transcriptional regulator
VTKRATSVDVARLAGVSQSTVSRTFSLDTRIAPETRAKVLAAAEQLGYAPNAIARSLSTNRTNIIGIVMANITNPFYPYVLEQFIAQLQQTGRQALLFTPGPNQDVDDVLPLALQYRVDGLIITSATVSSEMADEFSRQGTPVVLFNRYVLGANVSAVCCDNAEGGRFVANLLLDAGHKRLGYIAGSGDTSTNIDRERGFTDRLHERGVSHVLRAQGTYSYESGYESALQLLRGSTPPDALFCANDITAMGAIDAARFELGLSVPNDLTVIGFDDIPPAAWPVYSLTTIRQPVKRMIAKTLQLLFERIEQPDTPPVLELIPGELIRRSSARLEPK